MKSKILLALLCLSISTCMSIPNLEDTFSHIYTSGAWFVGGTYSGIGSTLYQTQNMRAMLPEIIKHLNIKTLLDAGCGDFNWMKITNLPIEKYIGVDIVAPLIAKNKEAYENETYSFYHLNIVEDQLPPSDLILCRDVLNHLPYKDIQSAISNFKKSGATYMMITMQLAAKVNADMVPSGWRPLNYQYAPFNFPAPLFILQEGEFESGTGKSLVLWKLADIDLEKIELI